jgi:Cu+-exporting ATPase
MCCGGCAKKIASKLYAVRGVKAVQCDVKGKRVAVVPQQNVVLSPRALWEAVEMGEDRPLQLVGPSGTFTTKPPY